MPNNLLSKSFICDEGNLLWKKLIVDDVLFEDPKLFNIGREMDTKLLFEKTLKFKPMDFS